MVPKTILFFLIGCVLSARAFPGLNKQSTSVQGKVLCNGNPVVGATVKLIDVDTARFDDLMAKVNTDGNGFYSLAGHASDPPFTTIDPVVQITAKCDGYVFRDCYRFKVPDAYITDGKTPQKVFMATDVELASVKSNC